MKKKYILFLAIFLNTGILLAQTYTQPSGSGVSSSAVTCSGTYYDEGGVGGNYTSNEQSSYTFYPGVAGQYITITFTAFQTQSGVDGILVYDGPGGALITTLTGAPAVPFTITAAGSTGALSLVFVSNGTNQQAGWAATVACTPTPGTPPTFTNSTQDCQNGGGTTVCSSSSFTGNSSGVGSVQDLPTVVNGCLGTENQSSWYYFSPSAAGNVAFTIVPANGTDDYDFAVYGPFTTVTCPYNVMAQPIRCSFAAGGGNTGLLDGSGDNTEGATGNRFVEDLVVAADEVYVLVIDNYTGSSQPFNLNWTLTNGASLDCTTLPIELLSFYGEARENQGNMLFWSTASETNNDFFTIERAGDDWAFEEIGVINGAGNSNHILNYSFLDETAAGGNNYYRIKQTDFDGQYSYTPILRIYNKDNFIVGNLYPNPTSNSFSLKFNMEEETELQIDILDLAGKLIRSETVFMNNSTTVHSLNVSELNQGIYFVNVLNSNKEIISAQKLVKE